MLARPDRAGVTPDLTANLVSKSALSPGTASAICNRAPTVRMCRWRTREHRTRHDIHKVVGVVGYAVLPWVAGRATRLKFHDLGEPSCDCFC